MSRIKFLLGCCLVMVAAAWPSPAHAAFPGEPGRIAFMRNPGNGGDWNIFTMAPNGADVRQLTTDPGQDMFPSWSADGQQLAFTTTRDGNAEIYVMQPDGSGQTRVTNNTVYDETPVFSPDGSRIAFVSTRDAPIACPTTVRNAACTPYTEVYVMDADGSNVVRLTNSVGFDLFPMFSPDGSKIAWVAQRDGNIDVWVMNADGTDQTRLTTDPDAQSQPSWSPDGTRIAFRNSPAATPDTVGNIWVMNADGSNPTQLTASPKVDLRPAWSPSGAKIIFRRNRTGAAAIYEVKADGTKLRQLTFTTDPVQDAYPDWQPLAVDGD
jgi:Tol biopolymer transport system component